MSFYSEFADYYDSVFPFEEATYAFIRERLPAEAARVLDIGCGTGDYCGRLASQGYEVVGIDPDQWMIERARYRFPAVRFLVKGMEAIGQLEDPFGSAICIGNAASHLPQHRMPGFIHTLHDRLRPWSVWILQTVNWDFVLGQETYRFPDIRLEERGVVFEREYEGISAESVLFKTRLTAVDNEVFRGETLLYPMRAADCIKEHERNGFELLAHVGSFAGDAFDPEVMSSSIFVFRRP
jgi:SAM-dependent methyltransferase